MRGNTGTLHAMWSPLTNNVRTQTLLPTGLEKANAHEWHETNHLLTGVSTTLSNKVNSMPVDALHFNNSQQEQR